MGNSVHLHKNNVHKKLLQTIERIDGAYASATIRAYRSNFEKFIDYCDSVNANALPAHPENHCKLYRYTSGG